MAAAIRQSILAALETYLETIDGTGSWRTTLTTVDHEARDLSAVSAAEYDYVGIVPETETWTDLPGRVEVTWSIDLYAYLKTAANTTTSVYTKLSDFATDLRRLIYTNPQLGLGTSGVKLVRIKGRRGTESLQLLAQESIAAASHRIEVVFEEDISDT